MTKHYLLIHLMLAGALLLTSGCAVSSAPVDPVDIEVVTDAGRVLPQYPTRLGEGPGVHRSYLEAVDSERYGIRVRNRSGERIGLVIAVDGRNVISGDKSYLRSDERMYILGPYQDAVYRGWRTADDTVHRFFFTDTEDSYADAWGDRSAIGVIAVAVYRERRPVEYRGMLRREGEEAAAEKKAPAASLGSLSDDRSAAGTGFGEQRHSPSRQVRFASEQRSVARYFLKYEWRDSLCRKGIIQCDPPNRFWPEEEYRFAPYPPGYRG